MEVFVERSQGTGFPTITLGQSRQIDMLYQYWAWNQDQLDFLPIDCTTPKLDTNAGELEELIQEGQKYSP